MLRTFFTIIIISLGMQSAVGQGDHGKSKSPAVSDPVVAVTEHQGRFNGTNIRYTATASETILKNDDGEPAAKMFSIAYVATGLDEGASRPVSFIWNGGPGSASVWLHMGAFGPKRVDLPSDARDDGAPPYSIIDNPFSILDVTDIVFIDPVGTGFSRTVGNGKASDFMGVNQDARSVARFIRQWISDNGRWNSPKYIGGESYGTTRSAAVINQLEGSFNDVSVNGILLISTILDFPSVSFQTGSEMPYISFLPTMAATAWYHGKVDGEPDLAAWAQKARDFAAGDYALALLKGDRLDADTHARVRAQLSHFTGLSEDYLERANLRVTASRFYKELLRDRGETIGRLDGRFRGHDMDDAGETPEQDPSFFAIDGAYTAAINHYLRQDLEFENGRQYSVIGGLPGSWDWNIGRGSQRAGVNVAPWIGTAMRQNSDLRVFNAAGYYDFATPFFGAEMSLQRNGLVADRITYAYYEAGHMMYIHHPSLDKLNADIRAFILAGQ